MDTHGMLGDPDNPWDSLTETQKRRLHLRFRGFSLRQIARLEGVHFTSIRESLLGCANKITSLPDILSRAGMS